MSYCRQWMYLAALALTLGCTSGANVDAPATPTTPHAGTSPTKKGNTGTTVEKAGTTSTASGGLGSQLGSGDGPAAKPVYPQLELQGTGQTNCSESLATTTAIATDINDAELTQTVTAVHVNCYQQSGPFGIGGCEQGKFDQTVNTKALGTTHYVRATQADLDKFSAAGGDVATYAIYAMAIVTNHGDKFTFDKPLPVFPWPAALVRYAPLDNGPKTWAVTATSSTTGAIAVSVEVSKQGVSGDEVALAFDVTINSGTATRLTYGQFPLPHQAVYHVNTTTLDVRSIDMQSWFTDKNCANSGEVSMTYNLCRKITNGQTQQLGC